MVRKSIGPLLFIFIILGLSAILPSSLQGINTRSIKMDVGKDSIIMVPKSNVTILHFQSAVSKVLISERFHAGILDKNKVTISRLKVSDEIGYIEIRTSTDHIIRLRLKCSDSLAALRYYL